MLNVEHKCSTRSFAVREREVPEHGAEGGELLERHARERRVVLGERELHGGQALLRPRILRTAAARGPSFLFCFFSPSALRAALPCSRATLEPRPRLVSRPSGTGDGEPRQIQRARSLRHAAPLLDEESELFEQRDGLEILAIEAAFE